MGGVVDAPQTLRVDVAVDLRRRERAVAEQLLNRAKIRAAFEQMRCERVAQPVWVRSDAPQRAGVEPPSARREEQRVVRARRERGPRLVEIARHPVRGFFAERDDAFLATFAVAYMNVL